MKISVISPVKNEVDFIGYSVMAAMPYVDEFVYAVSPSTDGTEELLDHLKKKYPDKIKHFPFKDFDPLNMVDYDSAYNACIERAEGPVLFYLHPDMIIVHGMKLDDGPLAWWTNIRSFARDFNTQIISGRASRWKNIHVKKFGIHYYGGYGSINEDFYYADITGTSHKHYNEDFDQYPFEVVNSGFVINHYCELKNYKRRLEKMKLCLRTQFPNVKDDWINEIASNHPRVTLEEIPEAMSLSTAVSAKLKETFKFAPTKEPIPNVFEKYKEEFSAFKSRKTTQQKRGELANV